MESKHTLGKWRVEETGTFPKTNHYFGIYCDSGTGHIAKVEGFGVESEANAYLIAAAPQLLAACEAALEFCPKADSYPGGKTKPHACEIADQVREAIAAARGKEGG